MKTEKQSTPPEEKKKKRKSKKVKKTAERLAEKWEESPIRDYFVRVFGNIRFRNEQQFLYFAKWMIFLVLIVVELLMMLWNINEFSGADGKKKLVILLIAVGLLTLSEGLKLFIIKGSIARFILCAIEAAVACCFVFFADGTYPLILYILVLTEFYIGAEKMLFSVWVFCGSMPLYAICYGLRDNLYWSRAALLQTLRDSIGPMVALSIHFLVVHIALAFYRQYLKLDKANRELDASKKELEKAYEVVAEVTALEERQRIAKEIHDTAGHSVTTVIMQTEAAKRIIESNPEEAKAKIIAANLQAKHALEELRDSVHLLSGVAENKTLKDALLGIIHESTDGTGINIRSEIEEVEVSAAKYRFLCNSLKESISNGLRHGGATAFWFELKSEDGKIKFLLSDNGKGVDGEVKLGFGLRTMQERARALGGEATVVTEIEEGFELRLELPLDTEYTGDKDGKN